MTFLTDIEEVDVDIEEFNELVDYDETYRPQDLLGSPTSDSTNSPEKSQLRPPSPI
ncbi:hypothetical protein [Halorussus caseinilyticus]|uniref:Uncharacterized protein n=1 Tax=Halorussus caseinilyticus TaxID=3034025 RepID=A0ABD5WGY8_9EURY